MGMAAIAIARPGMILLVELAAARLAAAGILDLICSLSCWALGRVCAAAGALVVSGVVGLGVSGVGGRTVGSILSGLG